MKIASGLTIAVLGLVLGQSKLVPPAFAKEKPPIDTAKIEAATGLKGTFNTDENVFKVSKPRTDVAIRVDGWQMPPFMGLTSWAAFTPAQDGQLDDDGRYGSFRGRGQPGHERRVRKRSRRNGVAQSFFLRRAEGLLHAHRRHGRNRSPRRWREESLRQDRGDTRGATRAAEGVHRWKDRLPSSISPQPLETILGKKGQSKDGMFKVVIGRSAAMHGVPIAAEMGVNTWAAFAGTDEEAVVDGDFAMTESELQTVLKAMRKEGINIVAIHQHMSMEEPRILFLHYWGKGKAANLAQSLESVLKAQAAVR